MIVAKDNSGDFTSIQEAINAAKAFPPEPIEIFIKNGVYHEKVKLHSWNTSLSLKGENEDKTIITYDDHFNKINRGRNSTFHTYTLLAAGSDCVLENLTIMNTSGEVGQAVALHVEADRCIVRNVRIIGSQDTLYAAGENCRQYYKDCRIEGTTDFIFGCATALFEGCTIHSKSGSYITAASTPRGVAYGYTFQGCRFTSDEGVERAFLGRPWRRCAKTVLIGCELGPHIAPEGWEEWDNADEPETAFYAEYNSSGPGADPSKRVWWSRQLTKAEAAEYSKEKILLSPNQISPRWF